MSRVNSTLASPIRLKFKNSALGEESIAKRSSEPLNRIDLPTQPLANVVVLGLLGAAIYLISFSFEMGGYLAFIAVVPWAWIVIDARKVTTVGYGTLWAAGVLLWLGLRVIAGLDSRLSLALSDIGLTLYCAAFLPMFIFVARAGRERIRLPLIVWTPIAWCGVEYLRQNIFGGFSLGALSHSAAYLPEIVQVADLFGSTGVDAWMVGSSAAVTQLLWTFRRVRFLERRVALEPEVPRESVAKHGKTLAEDVGGFTSAGQFRPRMHAPGAKKLADKAKVPSSVESMKIVLRRTRDHARERDLTVAAFSILLAAVSIFLARSYGTNRVRERANWKRFESYNFVVSAMGGVVNRQTFDKSASNISRTKGLVVYATTNAGPQFPSSATYSVLSIGPTMNSRNKVTAQSTRERWVARLTRFTGQFANHDLGTALGHGRWITPKRPLAALPIAFPRSDEDVDIRILPILANGATLEQTLNDSLNAYVNKGKSIDAAVIVVEPSALDGRDWPRLCSRATIIAAAANRCPLIAMIPDHDSFVAAGDGATHQASAVGKSASEVVTFSAMIDPRSSLYATVGNLPVLVAFILSLFVSLWKCKDFCSQAFSKTRPIQLFPGQPAHTRAPVEPHRDVNSAQRIDSSSQPDDSHHKHSEAT